MKRKFSDGIPFAIASLSLAVSRSIVSAIALCLFLFLAPGFVCAQDGADTAGPPRFLLNPGGPVATVRVLRFTPNSQRLLAGGGDKAVFTWGLHREDDDAPLRLTANPPLHWEISRAHRGFIYCMAISPDGKLAAIGGMSARDSNGDIWIFDLEFGELATVLRGHRQTIAGLDFSPDGKYLASSSKDGDTRVWTVDGWASKSIDTGNVDALADPRPVLFLSNTQLAVALTSNDRLPNWQIGIASVSGNLIRRLPNMHQERIMALARDGKTGRWASADKAGAVLLWNGTGDQTAKVLRDGRVATALAFAPGNRLFVSTTLDRSGNAVLELWDTNARQRMDQVLISKGEDNFACDVSANGKYLATYASDDSDILVWELEDETGKTKEKPLSQSVTTRVRGGGHKTWHVAFDKANTYRLGIGQELDDVTTWDKPRAKISSAFDLQARAAVDPAEHNTGWRSPEATVGEASIKRLESGRLLPTVVNGAQGAINLDRSYQGPASCYCWLNGPDGKPYAIAIGTDIQCGIFVYGLPRNGRCELLRYFRHHYGWITSLSASADGKYLASASVDGTIKIWSLEGLRQGGNGFSQYRSWGGTLIPKGNNRLLVSRLHEAGILAGRGLDVGDEIIGVQYFDGNQVARAGTAREMLDALEENPLWQTVVVSVLKQGKGATERILFVPAWDPLMSLYIDREGEWATWTPQGYYDSSIAGDERFGWILNAAQVGRRPRFLRAERLRGDLERPDILDRLLNAGSLPEAMRMAGMPAGRKESGEQVTKLASYLPDVKILNPSQDASLKAGEKIVTTARVEFPSNVKMDDFEPSMYVNGIPGGKAKKKVEGRIAYYEWETPPPNKYNVVRVSADRFGEEEDDVFSDDQVNVRADIETKPPKLHFIGLAASEYAVLPLSTTINDVESVAQTLTDNSGRYYEMETRLILLNHKITKATIERLVDELQQNASRFSPNDLLVVYLAGHGVSIGEEHEYFFLPPDPAIVSLDAKVIRDKAISWRSLRKLADAPCRKVFMIDTCLQSDQAASLFVKNAGDHLKSAVRPLRRREALVVTACGLGQQSFEIDTADFKHGLFTAAVLEGLQGYADGVSNRVRSGQKRDKTVDLSELISYVMNQVPVLAASVQKKQQPTCSSTDLGFVPLIKY